MAKITYAELRQMMADPDVPEERLRPYLTVQASASGPFRPSVVPNSDTVEISEQELALESAMGFGNAFCRWRREARFRKRLSRGDKAPVLVSEGDSWFQFPFLIDDVIDQLGDDYNIRSLGAAGDTAENMVFGKPEFMRALTEHADVVKAFLFSAAGNDIIGEDLDGVPVLEKLLRQSQGGEPAEALIDRTALNQQLDSLRRAYRTVIETIRSDLRFRNLPIVVHGYDYAIPGSKDDPRRPIYAEPDEWLGGPLVRRNILDPEKQRDIIRILIDALYDMLGELTREWQGIYVVNARGALPNRSDWNDEIHGTSAGFGKVAARFRTTLKDALSSGRISGFARDRRSHGVPWEAAPTAALAPATIVIDPGHGGTRNEGGSSSNNAVGPTGTLEKDKTLDLGMRVANELGGRGHRVLCTRKTDRNLGLAQRAAVARNAEADVFLSIHFNGWKVASVQGTETYFHAGGGAASRLLAQAVQTATLTATGLRDRGIKPERFGVLQPARHAPDTAAALLEVSFITDPVEEARLQDGAYLDRLASAIGNGVEAFLRDAGGMQTGLGAAPSRRGSKAWPATAARTMRTPPRSAWQRFAPPNPERRRH